MSFDITDELNALSKTYGLNLPPVTTAGPRLVTEEEAIRAWFTKDLTPHSVLEIAQKASQKKILTVIKQIVDTMPYFDPSNKIAQDYLSFAFNNGPLRSTIETFSLATEIFGWHITKKIDNPMLDVSEFTRWAIDESLDPEDIIYGWDNLCTHSRLPQSTELILEAFPAGTVFTWAPEFTKLRTQNPIISTEAFDVLLERGTARRLANYANPTPSQLTALAEQDPSAWAYITTNQLLMQPVKGYIAKRVSTSAPSEIAKLPKHACGLALQETKLEEPQLTAVLQNLDTDTVRFYVQGKTANPLTVLGIQEICAGGTSAIDVLGILNENGKADEYFPLLKTFTAEEKGGPARIRAIIRDASLDNLRQGPHNTRRVDLLLSVVKAVFGDDERLYQRFAESSNVFDSPNHSLQSAANHYRIRWAEAQARKAK